MIGKQITGTLIGLVLGVAAVLILAAWFGGVYHGKTGERAKWDKGVEDAAGRADDGKTQLEAGADIVPAVIERETNTIYQVDQKAIQENIALRGELNLLHWRLENDKNSTSGDCSIPDTWRVQHTDLDSLLYSGEQAGRTRASQDKPGVDGGGADEESPALAGYP